MFDIGFWELIVISVVGLVVLGPERLPSAIRSITSFMQSARNMANSVKAEITHELKISELHADLKKAEQMSLKDVSPELQKSIDKLKDAAQSVNRPYGLQKENILNSETATPDDITPNVNTPKTEEHQSNDVTNNQDNNKDTTSNTNTKIDL